MRKRLRLLFDGYLLASLFMLGLIDQLEGLPFLRRGREWLAFYSSDLRPGLAATGANNFILARFGCRLTWLLGFSHQLCTSFVRVVEKTAIDPHPQ